MSQCFNPNCLQRNSASPKFCQKCGNKLLLGDRYRAIDYLSEGGFGRTFRAIDQNFNFSPIVLDNPDYCLHYQNKASSSEIEGIVLCRNFG